MAQFDDKDTIRQVQQKLKTKGKDVESDGSMGPKTQQAVREYQQEQGMQPSGQLDEETCESLGIEPQQQ